MNARSHREEELFEEALGKRSDVERAAFLDAACRDNPHLRARMEALLEGHLKAEGFLENPPERAVSDAGGATVLVPVTEKPGDRIGRYKLLQQIGEGGCGVVYMAEQEEPVRRRVALKVIKLGMDTKNVIARFEAERQALALMDHPNIAKVLDADATETGRPYFVMELVRGIKITDYCDQNNLPTRQRLDLFIQVCHAIQHAHQKGIIHRDIKPSNILVSLHDGVPVPVVIDFGIAKATEQRLTDKTLFTAFEQFIGTPAYTSPEQAEMSRLDIDTRSDIYSLGVLLYELLTGKTPFDSKELLAAGLDEMRRTIREKEPARPSTRLNTLQGEELTTTAKRRGTEAPKLIHLVAGDLDWIVMKCLEKDRTRRYETANGLALDIERHLNSEPVVACPPSTAYRVQKFVRRNKVMVTAGTAVAAALVLGVVVSTWQAVRASRLRVRAETNEQKAVRAEQKAVVAMADEAKLRQLAQAQAYASDMKVAQMGLEQNNRGLAVDLLRRHVPNKAGEQDLRGIEWRYLWQASQSDEVRSFPHPGNVNACALSPDGRYLATTFQDQKDRLWRTRIWQTDSGNVIQEFPSGGLPAVKMWEAFSPEGSWLAVRGKAAIEIRDTASWKIVKKLPGTAFYPASWPASICISQNGRVLVSSVTNGLGAWKVENWSCRVLTNAAHNLLNLAVSPDGTLVAYSDTNPLYGERGPIQLWNPETGRTNTLARDQDVGSLAISPDGKWLASGHGSGEVCLWDLKSLRPVRTNRLHRLIVRGLAFAPDGGLLASAGYDQLIQLWMLGAEKPFRTLRGHEKELYGLSFSGNGRLLASTSLDGTARLWEVQPSHPHSHSFTLPADGLPLGPSKDGNSLLMFDRKDSATQRRQLPDGELVRSNSWIAARQLCGDKLRFLAQNQLTIGVTSNGTVHLWDLETGVHLKTIGLGGSSFDPHSLSSDQHWLVGTDMRRPLLFRLLLFDLRAQKVVPAFAFEAMWTVGVAFSPDNRWLAYSYSVGPYGGEVSYLLAIWDLSSSRPKLTLEESALPIGGLAFSPDSEMLVSGGWDGEIRAWSVRTGKPVLPPLKGHIISGDQRLAFAADGKTLVSYGGDRSIRLWSVATGQEMLVFRDCSMVSGNELATYDPDYTCQAYLTAGDRWLLWRERVGPIQVTPLPTLAEIDSMEKSRR